jgi:hypothetical protein
MLVTRYSSEEEKWQGRIILKGRQAHVSDVDVNHMKVHGVHLNDFQYMSDATNKYANAQPAQDSLDGRTMPPSGPFWTPEQLGL